MVLQVEKESQPATNREGGEIPQNANNGIIIFFSHTLFMGNLGEGIYAGLPFNSTKGQKKSYTAILWITGHSARKKWAPGHKICSWLRVITSALIKYMWTLTARKVSL